MRHTPIILHYTESPEAEVEQKLPSYTAGGIDSGYQGYARNARDVYAGAHKRCSTCHLKKFGLWKYQ